MPDGLNSLVALNVLSFSLYATALGIALMSWLFVLAVRKERWPKVVIVVGLFVAAGNSVLHTPWAETRMYLAQTTAMLLLQGGILTYLLSGRYDVA